MTYTALYRQWRPKVFDDVVGQDAIIRVLKNQIKSGRIAHAYLFSGPRGTGKTSTAQIFAHAINCLAPFDGNPCGSCEVCRRLSSADVMDIIEIDAASNNGVDEIRELREKVKFPPAVGRYKVYIVDEVHMLSIGAFNALLKTLEEPPRHIVFILATTEPHRLPTTILSRCQRYDFKRIPVKVMTARMRVIAREMGVDIDEEALNTIARWADGGMRDALSLMDQCIGLGGGVITNQDVLSILGSTDQEFILTMIGEIIKGDLPGTLRDINQLVEEGRNLPVFLKELIYHIRNILMIKICGSATEIIDADESTIEEYRRQASVAGEERLIRAIEILSSVESELKWASRPRISLELAMVKICRPQLDDSVEGILDRIRVLEEKVASGMVAALDMGSSSAPDTLSERKSKEKTSGDGLKKKEDGIEEKGIGKEREDSPSMEDNSGDKGKNIKGLVEKWPEILKTIRKERMALYSFLKDSRLRPADNGVLNIIFPSSQGFFVAAVEKEDNRRFVESVVSRFAGTSVRIKCVDESDLGDNDIEENDNDDDDVVRRAIEIFGEEFVEVVEDEEEP